MDRIIKEQVEAVILGVAVGDALGVPVEFKPRGAFKVKGMTGYGTHNQPAGTWSDDTSLSLCLADAMSHDWTTAGIVEKTAKNFIRWVDDADFTAHGNVFDIGISTSKAIKNLKAGRGPAESGCADVSENGNGSLMRIAPLVFYIANKPETERLEIVRRVSGITHAHSWSVAACFIYLEYLRSFLFLHSDKKAAYSALRSQFDDTNLIDSATICRFERLLWTDITRLPEAEIKSGGLVVDTLEAAMWCFLTTENYRDAVLKAVNLGSDTDTTAAVTGGLAGLYYGLENIPQKWVDSLARLPEIREVCLKLATAIADTKQA
jgi:ADP-ribosylglycohydrolase